MLYYLIFDLQVYHKIYKSMIILTGSNDGQ